jgi:hypothetical protein
MNKRLTVGDIVMRTYPLGPSYPRVGLIIDRDNNGYLTVMWGGGKVEHMWDDQDLIRIDDECG